ncbi:MAG: DUF5060 domain-containing protein [Kiritimatiellae bacterium]|nr:DUF5060 domain-containing protein [Kiritimatiellia bacterium]
MQAPTVGQWDRFEASVRNPHAYANPYEDVTLAATYRKPNGDTVAFWGFHDGGSEWKLRFMPDQAGTWRYSAVFDDGTPGAEGVFECVASNVPGMIAADEENPLWFGFRGGGHLLVRSLHVGDRFFASNWAPEKRTAFLDWAGRQGYNMLSIASHYLNRRDDERGAGWDTPRLWPLNAGEWRRMEAILDELAARRLLVYPFAGFFGQSSNFPVEPAGQQALIRYGLARLGPYWNLLFNVAGPEPLVHPQKFHDVMPAEDINRLGSEIARLDVFGHPLSIHNGCGDDPFRDADWSSYVTLQGFKGVNWAEISEGLLRNHPAGKPVYAQEVFWPGNTCGHGELSDSDIRKKAFVLIMSAAAINFGDMAGKSSSGFSGTLDPADCIQARHDIVKRVWDFFQTVPFHRMRPRQDLVSAGYCLAEEGARYLVYLPAGGSTAVRVAGGPYRACWINAQQTADRRDGGRTFEGRSLAAPRDGEDWLLWLAH